MLLLAIYSVKPKSTTIDIESWDKELNPSKPGCFESFQFFRCLIILS